MIGFIEMRFLSVKYLKSISYIAMIIILNGCCYPKDPVIDNQTSITSANFWEPRCYYESEPCDDGSDENFVALLRHSSVKLADLIDVALRNNPTTQRTWADARAAAYNVGVARSALYPQINALEQLDYIDTRLDDSPPVVAAAAAAAADPGAIIDPNANPGNNTTPSIANAVANPLVSLTSELSVSYLLLDFGGRCATIEAAKQALYTADWTHNRQIQAVIFAVLQNYYAYEGLLALLESREADLKNAKTSLDAAQNLFDAGVKNKLDVLQARTNLINIELAIVDLERQRNIARGNLATVLGLVANADFNIPRISQDFSLDHICANLDRLIAIAIDQRPDLAAVYAEHERLKAEVIIARSQGLPTITANMNFEHMNFFKNANLNNRTYSGSIALNIPLFNGFLYLSQERRAKEFVRESCAHIRETKLNVALDVFTSYSDFQSAVESYQYSDAYLKNSTEAYNAALVSYKEGISTILDLLLAQRDLATAKAQRIEALTRWAISLASVSFATGSLGTLHEDDVKCRTQKIKLDVNHE